ncbi:unnamed protein product [Menidia menidia]|uniref:(Atlantic silverside) hypothetical protein n=1 Tax=Menidia menidia TaxID=238744 RepID=A0A8S4BS65_9TELE|nr:unnamed protein product [Menidia menidia]
MEQVFLRFDSYNFEGDQRFVDGLKTLQSEGNRDATELLNLKLFFYNRFVEPIDRSCYHKWSSSSSHATPASVASGQQNLRTLPCSESDTDKKHTTETGTDSEMKQISFAEVMRLVQEGKEVP